MKKSARIREFTATLSAEEKGGLDARYRGFFVCFNAQRYYEAHDVLEDLWLEETGGDHAFFKGLIQLAGAFVHLQKQRARPLHPKDGRRLHPAARLFRLAARNLAGYRPRHRGLDVEVVLALIHAAEARLSASAFSENPWHPDHAPHLELE
jgi:predicted metal-dependent hydrolase